MSRLSINDVRSEALFASTLQRGEQPTAAEVRAAIAEAIRVFGSRGCAARMAQEFGDRPEAALPRMRWARRVVAEVFAAPAAAPVTRLGGSAERADTVPAWAAGMAVSSAA
jgi:hypothetical protein